MPNEKTTQDTTWKVSFTAREKMSAFIIIRAKTAEEAAQAASDYIQVVTPELDQVQISSITDLSPEIPTEIVYKETPPSERMN